jgi:hypothetical protein
MPLAAVGAAGVDEEDEEDEEDEVGVELATDDADDPVELPFPPHPAKTNAQPSSGINRDLFFNIFYSFPIKVCI